MKNFLHFMGMSFFFIFQFNILIISNGTKCTNISDDDINTPDAEFGDDRLRKVADDSGKMLEECSRIQLKIEEKMKPYTEIVEKFLIKIQQYQGITKGYKSILDDYIDLLANERKKDPFSNLEEMFVGCYVSKIDSYDIINKIFKTAKIYIENDDEFKVILKDLFFILQEYVTNPKIQETSHLFLSGTLMTEYSFLSDDQLRSYITFKTDIIDAEYDKSVFLSLFYKLYGFAEENNLKNYDMIKMGLSCIKNIFNCFEDEIDEKESIETIRKLYKIVDVVFDEMAKIITKLLSVIKPRFEVRLFLQDLQDMCLKCTKHINNSQIQATKNINEIYTKKILGLCLKTFILYYDIMALVFSRCDAEGLKKIVNLNDLPEQEYIDLSKIIPLINDSGYLIAVRHLNIHCNVINKMIYNALTIPNYDETTFVNEMFMSIKHIMEKNELMARFFYNWNLILKKIY